MGEILDQDQKSASEHNPNDWIDVTIRFALVALILYWSFLLLRPFIAMLIWATILSIALHPVYVWLRRILGNRSTLASVLLTLLALIVLLGPVSTIGAALIKNLSGIAAGISEGTVTIPPPPAYIAEWPFVGSSISAFWQSASVELPQTLKSIAPHMKGLAGKLLRILGDIGIVLLQFTLAIIIAGFIYSRATGVEKSLKKFAMRAAPQMGGGFIDLAGETVRSVARGIVGISLIQAILFGICAMFVALPLAGLWTFIVLILSIIQVGPGLVIIPVIIYGWISMDTLGAAMFTAYMVPVMFLDNALKPILIGRGLQVPMLVIFIGVIGGIIAHGLIGLFVGPIILAFGYELGRAWITRGSASGQ